ncbi:MAG: FUSC family protein [Candidatus Nanopelagicales bacterium]
MNSFAHRVTMSMIEVDLSAARWVSALRRAGVVVLLLVLGLRFAGTGAAVSAATAALLIGLLDKGRSPRSTWHTMAAGTALLTLVTLFDTAFANSGVATLVLMVVLAFASGVSSGVDPRAPQVFVFGAILAATHLVTPQSADRGLEAAAAIALAGGLQTLLAFASAPIVRDRPERRRIATALRVVGDNVKSVGRSGEPNLEAGSQEASAAMAGVADYVSKSDLAADHRARYALILADVDALRIEARAYYARASLGLAIPSDRQTREVFGDSGKALGHAATAIEREHEPSLQALDDQVAALQLRVQRAENSNRPMTRTAKSLIDVTGEMPDHVRKILRVQQRRRAHRSNSRTVRDRVAASMSWGSRPLRFGIRMTAAALLAELISLALHLEHGSWVAVSAMMLLRPDIGPAAPRILIRAVGVTLGVGVVVGIAAVLGDSTAWQVATISVLVFLMYAVVSVNQGTQTILMTTTIILLLSIGGLDPTELAFARWVDVLIGCLIGTAFALAIPLWNRTSLTHDAATYADAVGDWFRSLVAYANPTAATDSAALEEIRHRGQRARDARMTVNATLSASLLEPADRKVSAGTVGVVLSWIRRCSDSGVAAEALLRHGSPMPEVAQAYALAAAGNLRDVSATLRGNKTGADDAASQSSLPRDLPNADRVTEVLLRAARTANAAKRSSSRVGSA